MKRPLAACPLVLLCAACFLPKYRSHWPYRGPMIEVVNPGREFVALSARDGAGRVLSMGTVAPRSKACRAWPFIHDEGSLLTVSSDHQETASEAFNPWAFNGWRWTIGSALEAAAVCGT